MQTLSFLLFSGAALGLVSCSAISNVQKALVDGAFNPLKGPGSQSNSSSMSSLDFTSGVSFMPGQWIEASMPNTTFFLTIPQGDATADKILQSGTPLKYILTKASYVKVELDSGDIGFVPENMVTDRAAVADIPIVPRSITPLEAPVLPDDGFVPVAPGDDPNFRVPNIPPIVPDIPSLDPTLPALPVTPSAEKAKEAAEALSEAATEAPAPPKVDGVTD